jgi:RNA polymerase sigma-70 factor (family 1)
MKPEAVKYNEKGIEQTFVRIYNLYSEVLSNFLGNLCGDSDLAEDLCQETFTKLWERRENFAKIKDLRAYIFRMAKNEFITHIRREKRKKEICNEVSRDKAVDISNVTEEFIDQRETEAFLQQAIQKLSPQRRRVYVLGKMEGLKLDDIARLLNLAPRTVVETMRMANKDVRKYIMERREESVKEPKKAARKKMLQEIKIEKAA